MSTTDQPASLESLEAYWAKDQYFCDQGRYEEARRVLDVYGIVGGAAIGLGSAALVSVDAEPINVSLGVADITINLSQYSDELFVGGGGFLLAGVVGVGIWGVGRAINRGVNLARVNRHARKMAGS